MIKKITLTLVIAVSLVTAFVGCSSDVSSEEQQNFNHSYNINPPSWLVGHHWEDSSIPERYEYIMFRSDNIIEESTDWKHHYEIITSIYSQDFVPSAKFYEKSNTATYYEAEQIINNKLERNIKVEKISNTSIKVTLTYYWEDSFDSGSETLINTYKKID